MYDKTELERVLLLQRSSFLQQGDANLQQRVSRTSRMALALLENIDVLSDTLCADYGWRHASVSKAFEGMSWVKDIEHTLAELAQWMAPRPVPGGFVQAKPKGVVGIMGAWNFPLTLTFQPAMAALAAGNRVMLNFPEQHPRTGALLREIFNARFDESEVTLFNGDLATATQFATLKLDHLFFTGSPEVGSLVSEAAAKNLVPVTLNWAARTRWWSPATPIWHWRRRASPPPGWSMGDRYACVRITYSSRKKSSKSSLATCKPRCAASAATTCTTPPWCRWSTSATTPVCSR